MKFGMRTILVVQLVAALFFVGLGYRIREARRRERQMQNAAAARAVMRSLGHYRASYFVENPLVFYRNGRIACFLSPRPPYRQAIDVDSIAIVFNQWTGNDRRDFICLNRCRPRRWAIPYAIIQERRPVAWDYVVQVPYSPWHYGVTEWR